METLLIFDFGGVLMKTVDYTPRHQWDKRLGLPVGSVERAVHNDTTWREAQLGHISLDAYWQDVAARLNLSTADVQQLAVDFYSGDQLDATLIDYIRRCKTKGIPVALLSNDAHDLLLPKLRLHEIDSLFDPLVISSQIGVMKPAIGAYKAVMQHFLNTPKTSIFIDDRPENITGAEQAGIQGIHYQPQLDLVSKLDAIIDT